MLFKKQKNYTSLSLSSMAWIRFKKNRLGTGALVFILLFTLIAALGYLITPDPTPYANDQYLELGLKKPGFSVMMVPVKKQVENLRSGWFQTMLYGQVSSSRYIPVRSCITIGPRLYYMEYGSQPGNPYQAGWIMNLPENQPIKRNFLMGTDRFGRDYLSQLMIGTRVSLSVGFISVAISLLLGILIGSLGGFYRGRTDHFVMWLINVVWSIPTLLLVIAITFALGKGFWQVFVAVGLTMWVEVARVVRGQILSIREKEFVEAARALGYSDFRIIFHHILPNVMAAVIVISAANFASAILLEAGLSFLGLGVQPPVPSWGSMIKENYGYIVLDYAYLALLPGLAIMLMVLAFMLVGNALRDALDVRTS
ncbi:MAG TPA: ABC transporter permease [Bacteroidales bacterium]|nr:ABC transporter permease [Bacteroidales bacterium]HPT09572.1 ABC transporter permease [Bacteroidales bacterium]